MKNDFLSKLLLFALIIMAAFFRFYNLNWDQGYHLHPDERAIIMQVVHLDYPQNFSQFFSVNSPWNPHFFAYGSFPFYLLKIVGDGLSLFNSLYAEYSLVNIAGRFLSAFADLFTILLLYRLGKKLFTNYVGFLTAFFYGVSVLPIQLSHFYAVDTLLTLFTLATLYQLILFYEKPTIRRSLLVGFFFGLALATKVSAAVLLVSVLATLIADFALLFIRNFRKPHHLLSNTKAYVIHLFKYAALIFCTTFVTFAVFEPYAFIDFKEFWQQTLEQSQMTHNAFIFPYTLQYVGKIPYLYEAKNIFLYGLGPLLAVLAFVGTGYFIYLTFYKEKAARRWARELILLVFFLSYIFTVGKFAVGFMRYMLPVYPLFVLFAAVLINKLFITFRYTGKTKLGLTVYLAFLLLIWPVSFIHIYTQNNTRTDATNWILQRIPSGKTLAIEHWDDALPLEGNERYTTLTLPLYDPDTPAKWQMIKKTLNQIDYIIIASNRLYVPLMKLTDCKKLPAGKCYPQTAAYYKKLFAGTLGFQKVAQFTDYPTIPFLNMPINDQGADESFTVYDHPKVMIFQKTANPSFK